MTGGFGAGATVSEAPEDAEDAEEAAGTITVGGATGADGADGADGTAGAVGAGGRVRHGRGGGGALGLGGGREPAQAAQCLGADGSARGRGRAGRRRGLVPRIARVPRVGGSGRRSTIRRSLGPSGGPVGRAAASPVPTTGAPDPASSESS
ncbi:hypothetical protein GCM10018952_03930 [Streptosporangium vulgare]